MPETDCPYVSRGGLKLQAALDAFELDVTGLACADLGCSTGGFTDVLLQRGAARVYSVDTAYGELAWKLRSDDRVVVLERSNAVHLDPRHPENKKQAKVLAGFAGVDLVVLDLGWTKQIKAVPAALRWLCTEKEKEKEMEEGGGGSTRIITLIKPHYESGDHHPTDAQAEAISRRVVEDGLPGLGVEVLGLIPCPIRGGKGGNLEYLALLRPTFTA